ATALVDATMADVIERFPALMVELACEVYDVAAAAGVRLEPFDDVEPELYHPRERQDQERLGPAIAGLVARRRRDGKSKSGIWRDLAVRHRRTEVDSQPGVVLEMAAQHGLRSPSPHGWWSGSTTSRPGGVPWPGRTSRRWSGCGSAPPPEARSGALPRP
ncbi:2-dehydropantoate 2-reductase, partial [mine drainage metagenome]